MESNNEFGNITFDLPKNQSNVIKVIGVGGGGSNAINHMFRQGIAGVDFVVCNTDSQALQTSPVPNKIQLGVNLTEGLGAGAKPEVGQQAALESIEEIEKMLDANTKMVFITAGMGGGTGTGAAPVIAQLAKERGILTVGIVTIPFQFEGKNRSEQAMEGVERLRKQVDSLIVINNNKLREVYGNLGFKAGFSKADEVLATASKGIAEVITNHLTMNIDLKDAKTVLSDSGTAIMGSFVASGVDRAKIAIQSALDSPLLNDNKITGAKNVLLLITFGSDEITIDEISEINEYIQNEAGHNANIIMGIGEDDKLEESISVTVIATGFNIEQQKEIINAEPQKIIHSLDGEQKIQHNLTPNAVSTPVVSVNEPIVNAVTFEAEAPKEVVAETAAKIVFELNDFEVEQPQAIQAPVSDLIPTSDYIKNLDVFFENVSEQVKQPVAVVEQPTFTVETPVQSIQYTEPVAQVAPPVFEVVKPVQEFEIISNSVREIEVIEPEFVVANDDFSFSLDLFETKAETTQNTIVFELSEETKEIKVNEAVQFFPVTELGQEGIIKYTLEEEIEETFEPAATIMQAAEPIDEEVNFTVKAVATNVTSENNFSFDAATPVEMSIEEILKSRAEERKNKLKSFNHKFNNPNRIDDLEKEPAFRRQGLDVTSMPNQNNQSRMSLGMDSNDDIQLRSNNSFLHDNVD
ncbi:cell division protein FtsZ [Flavobacterium sp. F372]|uniref:Cell division protein FtsZ n=1 Tax=Flavobacterium bernardetii TaxID=2813823 RepID=A0ABR7IZX9_9FLAO|nr:cell division protein FtsZ [Flavobacterium bernardetii]MBC5835356.1 cell division protein FtsZ [Flavobacterium bernardetii]NHF69701.1 cell division protein FtsZ [Flavobacterium bernardetii]